MRLKTKSIAISAIFASVIAIFSIISIPTGVVPVSLSLFGVILSSVILERKEILFSVLIFILLGAFGLPVFAGLKGGVGVILSPTGGFIISYIFTPAIMGIRFKNANFSLILKGFLSLTITYIIGCCWFSFITHQSFFEGFLISVVPFIPFDILKVILALFLGDKIKRQLKKSSVL